MRFTLPFLAALSVAVASPIQSPEEGLAPLYLSENAQPIEDNYIVVFKKGVGLQDFDSHTLRVQDANALNVSFMECLVFRASAVSTLLPGHERSERSCLCLASVSEASNLGSSSAASTGSLPER